MGRIADLHMAWHVFIHTSGGLDRIIRIPYRSEVVERSSGTYTVYLDTERGWGHILYVYGTKPQIDILELNVFLAAGGPEWVAEVSSLSDLEYAVPESQSNIENGVGFLVGIVSKSIPFEGKCPNWYRNRVDTLDSGTALQQ